MKHAVLRGISGLLVMTMLGTVPVYAREDEYQGEYEEVTTTGATEEEEEEEEQQEENESKVDKSLADVKNICLTFKEGDSYIYTGQEIKPIIEKITFEYKDGIVEEAEAVTIEEYHNNIEIGWASVTISVEGYSGSVRIDRAFEIIFGNITSLKTTPITYKKTKLSWEKVAGADGYEIRRSTKSGSGYKVLQEIKNGATATYNDTSVTMGITYYYKVRAYRLVGGKKVYGAYTSPVKQRAQVATVNITSAKKTSYNSITVKWEKVSGASAYAIYRSTSAKGTYERIGTVKTGKTLFYTDKKRACGKTYYYKVAAYRTYKNKNYYGSKSVYIGANTTPSKVTFTSNTVAGEKSVTLHWKQASGATGYRIYRSEKEDSGYGLMKDISGAKTLEWTDSTLETEKTYYYKVRAYVKVDGKKVYGSYSSVCKTEKLNTQIQRLKKYVTVPYRYGGASTSGWDCSGFTQYAIKMLYGIEIPRTSMEQANGGKSVSKSDRSKWKPGDILVYASGGRVNHVAIYLGNGEMMHALNAKYGTIIQEVDYYETWDKKNSLKCVRRYSE